MKAGTAQKLALNMLSTATMVRLGRVLSSSMINVQLTNQKLRERAEGIVIKFTGASRAAAAKALEDSCPQPARGAFDDSEKDHKTGSHSLAQGRAERGGGFCARQSKKSS